MESSATAGFSNQFEGKVIEIFSGDSVIVEDEKGNRRKVFLVNTKAPTVDNREYSKSEPWAMEAKEFLRKRLVGKKAQVEIDYRKNI